MTSAYVEKRGDSYAVVVRYGGRKGRRKVVASGITSEKEARRVRAQVFARLQKQRAEVDDGTTVAEAIEARAVRNADKPSAQVDEWMARHCSPLAGRNVSTLSTRDVQCWIDALAASGVGVPSIRKAWGILRSAVAGLPHQVVTRDVKVPKAPRKHTASLSVQEARAVLPHVREDFRPLFALGLLTGARPGELVDLAKTDVLLGDRPGLVFRDVKTGGDRFVPLSPEAQTWARAALEAAPAGELVFGARVRAQAAEVKLSVILRRAMRLAAVLDGVDSLTTGWVASCRRTRPKRCGYKAAEHIEGPCPKCGYRLWCEPVLRRVRWYDLRATTATLLWEQDIPINVIGTIVGHTTATTTLRHYVDASAALARLSLSGAPAGHQEPNTTQPGATRRRSKHAK